MVSIGLSSGAATHIRLAVSCLWEVLAGVRILRDPGVPAVHRHWADRARPALPDTSLLWNLVAPSGGYTPDFLTPPPPGLAADLDRELAGLRATPPDVVRAQLAFLPGNHPPQPGRLPGDHSPQPDRLPGNHSPQPGRLPGDHSPQPDRLPGDHSPQPGGLPGNRPPQPGLPSGDRASQPGQLRGYHPQVVHELNRDPAAGLGRLADEIAAYWAVAIAPDWPRMRALLDAEVQRRARRLAEEGTAGLLNDLHRRVTWADGTLRIDQPHCTAPDVPDGTGLVLIPSVFVWPSVLSVTAGEIPQLAYPARGVATLWERASRAPDALGAVLGRGRARLLAELGTPLSTTELARRTGISPGGVSQHLSTLRAAGLVVTHRQGRALVNTRTPVADALLDAAG